MDDCPIDWPEPFGLVMIEPMACGTPVLAFLHGSVSEIVDQGVTGAIVDTREQAVRMLPRVIALDRHAVRRRFEQRFSSARMATDYVAIFRKNKSANAPRNLVLRRSRISPMNSTPGSLSSGTIFSRK
jgi:glycosyltransferase involved in cell wall biosynthesis